MTEVTIEYCVPCGLQDRAVQTRRELLETDGRELEAVRLETGDGGVFRVSAAEETIYDKETDEGFDMETVKADLERAAGVEAPYTTRPTRGSLHDSADTWHRQPLLSRPPIPGR